MTLVNDNKEVHIMEYFILKDNCSKAPAVEDDTHINSIEQNLAIQQNTIEPILDETL